MRTRQYETDNHTVQPTGCCSVPFDAGVANLWGAALRSTLHAERHLGRPLQLVCRYSSPYDASLTRKRIGSARLWCAVKGRSHFACLVPDPRSASHCRGFDNAHRPDLSDLSVRSKGETLRAVRVTNGKAMKEAVRCWPDKNCLFRCLHALTSDSLQSCPLAVGPATRS